MAKLGEVLNFEACIDIMDLLYERDETSVLYSSPRSLAASVLACSFFSFLTIYIPIQVIIIWCPCFIFFLLGIRFFYLLQVASYVITVPKQRQEFPVLPWGKILLVNIINSFSSSQTWT